MKIITKNKALFTHVMMVALLSSAGISLNACSNRSIGGEAKYPTGADRATVDGGDIYAKPDSIFGKGGLNILGGNKDKADDGSTGIGVNAYLWRAALDTVSFMPLASADPFGGVIITEWYTAEETPNERFKANVFILDRQLTSSGIQVKLFKQVNRGGRWVDAEVTAESQTQMEDAILERARQLRYADLHK
jgi:hypothetical protein